MSRAAGEAPAPGKGEPKPERRCESCGKKLSSYNPGPFCWHHTIGHPWRGPTAKPRG